MITAADDARRKDIPLAAIQLDISGAYDCLDRKYLFAVLNKIGFSDCLIDDIRQFFLGDSSSSILLNGRVGWESFNATRGTRQGDALSCMLYIIAVSPIFNVARRLYPEIGFQRKNDTLPIVGNQFCDDIYVWVSSNAEVSMWRAVMTIFEWASDQAVARNKSFVRVAHNPAGVLQTKQWARQWPAIGHVMGAYQVRKFLGINLNGKCRPPADFWLEQQRRVAARAAGWQTPTIPLAERAAINNMHVRSTAFYASRIIPVADRDARQIDHPSWLLSNNVAERGFTSSVNTVVAFGGYDQLGPCFTAPCAFASRAAANLTRRLGRWTSLNQGDYADRMFAWTFDAADEFERQLGRKATQADIVRVGQNRRAKFGSTNAALAAKVALRHLQSTGVAIGYESKPIDIDKTKSINEQSAQSGNRKLLTQAAMQSSTGELKNLISPKTPFSFIARCFRSASLVSNGRNANQAVALADRIAQAKSNNSITLSALDGVSNGLSLKLKELIFFESHAKIKTPTSPRCNACQLATPPSLINNNSHHILHTCPLANITRKTLSIAALLWLQHDLKNRDADARKMAESFWDGVGTHLLNTNYNSTDANQAYNENNILILTYYAKQHLLQLHEHAASKNALINQNYIAVSVSIIKKAHNKYQKELLRRADQT